jgi:hypothetical protein
VIFTLAFTALAYGQPQRTFVSAKTGNDANTANLCSLAFPCRNFNAAIGVVVAGGEVVALDSGGYGQVAIAKSVALISPAGVYAAITAITSGTNGINVAAGSTDTVILRGLTLTGLGGQTGIQVSSVGKLHVEGCVISGFTQAGIQVGLSADGSYIFISDTILRNNANGFQVSTTTGTVRASIDNCRAERSTNHGFIAFNNSRVTINRSVAAGSGNSGFSSLTSLAGAVTELSCEECVANNNNVGFTTSPSAGGSATINVSHSTATNNIALGFSQAGTGVFQSLGNSLVRGNSSDTSGTITSILAQ